MTASLEDLRRVGVASALDYHFARLVGELASTPPPSVALALALASAQTRQGHVCARLGEVASKPISGAREFEDCPAWPDLDPWLEELRKSPLVGDGSTSTPLVLDDTGRLYLFRYWEHERAVAKLLRERAAPVEERLDYSVLADGLRRFFGEAQGPDPQRDAALIATFQKLSIITGGPGTGKTHTVARILGLLTEQQRTRGERPLRTLALAPTGKAAARLAESIEKAKLDLNADDEVRNAISSTARTIHRALGTRRGSSTSFLHDKSRPLNTDLVIVDETSMVDVALMRRLLEAIPPSARVVLLGDRHQLASVEAGSVLADICGTGPHPGYSSELCGKALELGGLGLRERKERAPALVDSIVELTKSHRFDEKSGIAAFARAVNAGDGARAKSIAHGEYRDLVLGATTREGEVFAELAKRALPALSRVVTAKSPADALSRLEEFRVLCAHRRGPLGVTRINERLEVALEKSGVLVVDGPHYLGRPVMVLKNDHTLGLFNGDIGVIGRAENGARRAFFRDGQGGLRELSPLRLPPHETAFAMSIHKSQGSEFAEVTIVLPQPDSPLLTRELLYTAVTRARKRATLIGDAKCLEVGAARPVSRASGLEALLHE